jgi:hypothetical protein
MKKVELIEKIKRRLGYPMVKVELDDSQISDCIDYARDKFVKWAAGNSTQEVYFTVMLSAGQTMYEMPAGTTEIIDYQVRTGGSIHTLFTIENYLYNMGMYDMILMRSAGDGYSLISYHIARDFLDTVRRYVVDAYNYKYHRYTNMLEINPTPPSGGTVAIGTMVYNSPGFILVHSMQIEGTDEDLYTNTWVYDYATAQSKAILGRVRAKFANFTSIGNTGISLDGDAILSEARDDIEKLETWLMDHEVYFGSEIFIG